MHLLVLTEDFYPDISGGALVKWRMSQIAAENGHEVTVLAPREQETPRRERVDGVEIIRPFATRPRFWAVDEWPALATRMLSTPFLFLVAVVLVLRRHPDAVYSGSNTLHWIGAALERLFGLPTVAFVGYTPSLDADNQSGVKLGFERFNFSTGLPSKVLCRTHGVAETIASLSDHEVETVTGILNEERIRVASDRERVTERRESFVEPSSEDRLLAFVGRLTEIKNATEAVRVIADLSEQYHLVIVGDGPQRANVEATVDRLGVSDRVTLTGELAHEEALTTLGAADGLLLTSRTEAFPSVVFEGLAMGCHVFATPVGTLLELDHPRLHVQDVDGFQQEIRDVPFEWSAFVDETVLSEYSMRGYTEQVLDAIEEG